MFRCVCRLGSSQYPPATETFTPGRACRACEPTYHPHLSLPPITLTSVSRSPSGLLPSDRQKQPFSIQVKVTAQRCRWCGSTHWHCCLCLSVCVCLFVSYGLFLVRWRVDKCLKTAASAASTAARQQWPAAAAPASRWLCNHWQPLRSEGNELRREVAIIFIPVHLSD
mgnify:CR=1 FL=1